MKRNALGIGILALGMASGLLAAPPAESNSEPESEALEGFWPSNRMMELFLLRATDDAAEKYDLNDEQRQKLEKATLERWPRYFKENRRALQPLVNEYLESRMERDPPSKERVQAWSARATEIYDGFQKELNDSFDEVRKFLDPIQQGKLDQDRLKMNLGMQTFKATLDRWQRGEFKESEWWEKPDWQRKAEREKQTARRRAEQARPEAPAYVPLDEWERFVAEFAKRHNFDESQRNSADSILAELKTRATDYRTLHVKEIEELDGKIAAGEPADKPSLEARRQELFRPIGEMFSELKDRLSKLPTAAQIEAAKQSADG